MKQRKALSKHQDTINGFLFALHWITEFNPIMPAKWVGLENYRYIIQDPLLYKSLFNTFFYAFLSTPVNLCIALGLAMLINRPFRGRTLVRTIFFVPSIIPMVAATMVWIWMFDPTYGFINAVLGFFGIEGPAWLINPKTTKWALVMMGAWCTGTTMLICLAALQDVPKSYYESADIDGATKAVKFFMITLPCIAHVVLYQLILNLINAFQYFTQVYIITTASSGRTSAASGGPENSILMYPLYLFHNAFIYMRMGRASAMAWILFILIALLTLLMVKSVGKTINGSGGE